MPHAASTSIWPRGWRATRRDDGVCGVILKQRREIERFLSAPGKDFRAALIHGKDLGGVRERAQILARAATKNPEDPFDVAMLSDVDIDADPGRLDGELMAISMMGGRRLIRLRLSGDKASTEKVVIEALIEHAAGGFNPDAFLLIEASALKAGHPLRKTAEKAEHCVEIACYDDDVGDVGRFTREALAADRLSLTNEALDLFVARLPHERGVARREIERLILFLGPGAGLTAGAADLEGFFGVEPEASLADAANDAFGGRLAATQAGLRRAAQEGETGPAVVRALGSHLSRLRKIAVLQQNGTPAPAAAKAAGVFWKNEREILRQARIWTLKELDAVQPDVLAADRACKQTGTPDRLVGERLALAVAGKARRLGL